MQRATASCQAKPSRSCEQPSLRHDGLRWAARWECKPSFLLPGGTQSSGRHQWPPSVGRAWLVGVLTQLALPGVEMQMAPHTAARPHCRACTAMVILYRWIVVAATVAGSGGSASVLHAIFALIRSVCGVQLSSSAISIFFYGMLGFGSAFVWGELCFGYDLYTVVCLIMSAFAAMLAPRKRPVRGAAKASHRQEGCGGSRTKSFALMRPTVRSAMQHFVELKKKSCRRRTYFLRNASGHNRVLHE